MDLIDAAIVFLMLPFALIGVIGAVSETLRDLDDKQLETACKVSAFIALAMLCVWSAVGGLFLLLGTLSTVSAALSTKNLRRKKRLALYGCD